MAVVRVRVCCLGVCCGCGGDVCVGVVAVWSVCGSEWCVSLFVCVCVGTG